MTLKVTPQTENKRDRAGNFPVSTIIEIDVLPCCSIPGRICIIKEEK